MKAFSFISLIILYLAVCLAGCSHLNEALKSRYDTSSVSLASISLFDQRQQPKAPYPSWKGDWLFRRQRLALVDKSLRALRPDIVAFRDLMAKRGSVSDSDRHILSRGALTSYDWALKKKTYFDDTGEFSYHSVVTSIPTRIQEGEKTPMWPLGLDGSLSIYRLIIDQDPVLLVNLEIPRSSASQDQWYRVVEKKVKEEQEKSGICSDRTLLVGFLPYRSSWEYYSQLLSSLDLIDSAKGFCEVASECQTSTMRNPLFDSIESDGVVQRANRILLPSSALILNSTRILDENYLDPDIRQIVSRYGLNTFTPLIEYGWMTKFQLSKCQ